MATTGIDYKKFDPEIQLIDQKGESSIKVFKD